MPISEDKIKRLDEGRITKRTRTTEVGSGTGNLDAKEIHGEGVDIEELSKALHEIGTPKAPEGYDTVDEAVFDLENNKVLIVHVPPLRVKVTRRDFYGVKYDYRVLESRVIETIRELRKFGDLGVPDGYGSVEEALAKMKSGSELSLEVNKPYRMHVVEATGEDDNIPIRCVVSAKLDDTGKLYYDYRLTREDFAKGDVWEKEEEWWKPRGDKE